MRTAEFDYALPPELIAQEPARERGGSRLLVLDRGGTTGRPGPDVRHLGFGDFPSLIEPGDVLVVNDSMVIPARLLARRRGGGRAEVLLVRREEDGTWRALVKPGARIRAGTLLELDGGDLVEVLEQLEEGERRVRLAGAGGDDAILERRGHVPLPPYIARPDAPSDRERYQTVYATVRGSVAAPTAGLHFTRSALREIEARGARVVRVTLHVGPGTFRPVTVADPARHRMATEWYEVPAATAVAVREARDRGAKVWAVGTTSLRALESATPDTDRHPAPGAGWTSLFVRPGYSFRAVDRLLTNFHLPRSTLLMLVCAFAGTERVLAAYREAIVRRYRFYSYGDAMAVL